MPSSFHPRALKLNEVEIEERLAEAHRRARAGAVTTWWSRPPWSLGRVSAVARKPDGILKASTNPPAACRATRSGR